MATRFREYDQKNQSELEKVETSKGRQKDKQRRDRITLEDDKEWQQKRIESTPKRHKVKKNERHKIVGYRNMTSMKSKQQDCKQTEKTGPRKQDIDKKEYNQLERIK